MSEPITLENLEFDWTVEHYCEYQVPSGMSPSSTYDCGDAAAFLAHWYNDDGEEVARMWLCHEHWSQILRQEREKRA